MEIYRAIADFSEDVLLAYLRERSEAVGIPCKFSVFEDGGDDGRGSSSDEDRALWREGEHEARTWRERDTEDEAGASVCVRVKDRARSIDSGVCVETKRENGRGRKPNSTENGGREWCWSEAEGGGARVSCRAEGGQEVCKYDSEAAGHCDNSSGHLLEAHSARDPASSLVLAFRKGDLFGVSTRETVWPCLCLHAPMFLPPYLTIFVQDMSSL